MISVDRFWQAFEARGITFFSGVPCSLLQGIIQHALRDPRLSYVSAPREDAALGIASGAYMCGRAAGILLQNSGLGNLVNPLTSFNLIYRIPVLMIITWRGYLGNDAPEHLIMGDATLRLLEVMDIPYGVLEESNLESLIDELAASMAEQRIPAAILLRDGIVG
jgi:phosphonopyruvate decarboxylase